MELWATVDITTHNPLKLSFVMFLVSKYKSSSWTSDFLSGFSALLISDHFKGTMSNIQ